jgi:Zn-dependent M28 family amino/carboxypeptidase
VVPLADTVGGLGADTIATAGPADVVILGEGLSPDMDRLIAGAARSQGRELVAAPKVQGFFDRSDHYPFAAAGVPVLIATGIFAPQAAAANDRFFAERYHKPSDELDAGVRFDGAALDMELAYRVGVALANSRRWPGWRAGTPYAAARAAQRRRTP